MNEDHNYWSRRASQEMVGAINATCDRAAAAHIARRHLCIARALDHIAVESDPCEQPAEPSNDRLERAGGTSGGQAGGPAASVGGR